MLLKKKNKLAIFEVRFQDLKLQRLDIGQLQALEVQGKYRSSKAAGPDHCGIENRHQQSDI
jgi:hypothetical protein